MKPSKTLVSFVEKHLAGLMRSMNLTHFNIVLRFGKLQDATMQIEVDYCYLDAELTIDTARCEDHIFRGEKDVILACLAHECSHIITNEMSDPFKDKSRDYKKQSKMKLHFEERVTEHVSRLALRLYKLEVNYGHSNL